MKKIIFLLILGLGMLTITVQAQSSKKSTTKKTEAKKSDENETTEERHESHKRFWRKVGNDQKNFWKDEHEQHMKNKAAEEGKSSSKASVREDSRPHQPPKPPNPFKKKKKDKDIDSDQKDEKSDS